jgi:hypothetical protein
MKISKEQSKRIALLRKDLCSKGFEGIIELRNLEALEANENPLKEIQIVNTSKFEIKLDLETEQYSLNITMMNEKMSVELMDKLHTAMILIESINQVDYLKDNQKVLVKNKKGEIRNILPLAEVVYTFSKSNLRDKITLLKQGVSVKVGVVIYSIAS